MKVLRLLSGTNQKAFIILLGQLLFYTRYVKKNETLWIVKWRPEYTITPSITAYCTFYYLGVGARGCLYKGHSSQEVSEGRAAIIILNLPQRVWQTCQKVAFTRKDIQRTLPIANLWRYEKNIDDREWTSTHCEMRINVWIETPLRPQRCHPRRLSSPLKMISLVVTKVDLTVRQSWWMSLKGLKLLNGLESFRAEEFTLHTTKSLSKMCRATPDYTHVARCYQGWYWQSALREGPSMQNYTICHEAIRPEASPSLSSICWSQSRHRSHIQLASALQPDLF